VKADLLAATPSAPPTPARPRVGPAPRYERDPQRPAELPRRSSHHARVGVAPQPLRRQPLPARPAARPQAARPIIPAARPPVLEWPKSFDDWMIDIVRRRALRLNGGARRRGVRGSVRAVELAQILDRSADTDGRWRCGICHEVVTLNDLSFDHVVALADGGEHAAENLVPAHRKCNEIKGSEKAQWRAKAMDRWLDEWAGSTPADDERRYA
jgi:5-methylcytosine-specific restriction endonuclease McrA